MAMVVIMNMYSDNEDVPPGMRLMIKTTMAITIVMMMMMMTMMRMMAMMMMTAMMMMMMMCVSRDGG